MSEKLYNVGMYIRLSAESSTYRGNESESVENQQAILTQFINAMPHWVEKRTYIDNGAKGGNFNRRGFQDMMVDVETGFINLVLVKDLSRFGRNYLESGKYLEEVLPSYGCRFVALEDGIDTETGENDIMPLLNGMNDYYLKNLSDRIKLVLTAKAKDGQKLSGYAPYGYTRNPEEHTRLIVDEYAASVVKKMFDLRATGAGYAKIAGILNNDNILPPRLYYYTSQNREPKACTKLWADVTVKAILRNEIYIGHTTAFKNKTLSYREVKVVARDEDEWIRTENTHIPIIEVSVWENVQKINAKAKKRAETSRIPQESLFSKILVCTDCQKNMASNTDTQHRKNGKIVDYNNYYCRTYASTGGSTCSRHTIYEITLKKILLKDIKCHVNSILVDKTCVLEMLQKKLIGIQKQNKTELQKEKSELKQQLHKIELKAEQLYEDKVMGVISDEIFCRLSTTMESERQENETRLAELKSRERESATKLNDIDSWVRLVEEYAEVKDIDRDLLEALVEKIEIGEREVINGVKVQDIKIWYKFVGVV